MSNLFKKANVPYLVASSLATLTLISSLVLAVTSQVPLPLIIALSTLSVLVIALSYKAISNNRKMEVVKSKFAEKKQELENEITLWKEAKETANKQVGVLNNQLNWKNKELTGIKQQLGDKCNKIFELTQKKELLETQLREIEKKLEKLENQSHEFIQEKRDLENEIEGLNEKIAQLKEKLDVTQQKLDQKVQELATKTRELKGKMEELHNIEQQLNKTTIEKEAAGKQIGRLDDQLIREKQDSDEKVKRLNERVMTVDNLEKEKEELRAELDGLRRKVERLTKENKDLSEELKDTENFLESQFTELEEINKRRNNQVKKLKDSLLEKSFKRRQCEEALLKKKKEEVGFMQQTIEHVISKVRESVKGSEEIRGNDKKVILQIIQKIESVLEEEVAQYLPNEVSYAEFEDRGYVSRCSTPVRRY
ncbi:MAG: hypothetical protein LBJ80_05370 [Rickettsiales bacterium]|nr:hypothetical protein [Rickettsiales bacterium]MDR1261811.1 hypothetical protein [Rickettsiales bacterium]